MNPLSARLPLGKVTCTAVGVNGSCGTGVAVFEGGGAVVVIVEVGGADVVLPEDIVSEGVTSGVGGDTGGNGSDAGVGLVSADPGAVVGGGAGVGEQLIARTTSETTATIGAGILEFFTKWLSCPGKASADSNEL